MAKWVNITLEVEVAVPLSEVMEVAPGVPPKVLQKLIAGFLRLEPKS